MKIITDIEDAREAIEESKFKVFGISGSPLTRSEGYLFFNNFELICSNRSGESDSVLEKVKTNFFDISEDGEIIKKPEKIINNEKIINFINQKTSGEKIGIYFMKPSKTIQEICQKNKWKPIGNDYRLFNKLDDKLFFYEILKKIGSDKNFISLKLSDLDDEKINELFERLGNYLVFQLPMSGGGRGTVFVRKEAGEKPREILKRRIEGDKIKEKDSVILVNKFINGYSISTAGCVTRTNGILISHSQYQLIDIKEVVKGKGDAQGVFCGHDWVLSSDIEKKIDSEAMMITKKIGDFLKTMGYLGIFGIDFLVDDENKKVIPLELNPRLLGTFPTVVYAQMTANEVPLLAFHIMEHLGIDYRISSEEVFLKDQKREGAHLILFNPYKKDIIFSRDIVGGIYAIGSEGEIEFKRNGFELSDIQNDEEFVITDCIPKSGKRYKKNRKIFKVIARSAISSDEGRRLNKRGKKIVKECYKMIEKSIADTVMS